MNETNEFELSAAEFNYLKQSLSNEESLASLLVPEEARHGTKVKIRLNEAASRKIRDRLTTRLAEVGFDENYAPNAQGRMLEELIDRLFVR